MSLLIDSGLAIDTSLKIIEEQKMDKKLTKALGQVNGDLDKGLSVYDAFYSNRKFFSPTILAFIKSGDKSGKFAEILDQLSTYISEDDKNKATIKQALTYPIILLIVTVVIVSLLVSFVLPTFVSVFENGGQNLPKSTLLLINLTKFFDTYGVLILLFTGAIILSIIILRKDSYMRHRIDKFYYRFFPFKKIRREKLEYQVSSLLYILRVGDVEIGDSLKLIKSSFANEYIRQIIGDIISDIDKGKSLATSVSTKSIFSPLFKSMIIIGEDSGNLAGALEKASEYYSNDYIYKLKKISNMVEPLMIIIMSVLVGFVVFSVAIPIFDSVNAI